MLSFLFSIKLFYIVSAHHELGGNRELLRTKAESLFRNLHRNALSLDKDTARSNRTNEPLRITLIQQASWYKACQGKF